MFGVGMLIEVLGVCLVVVLSPVTDEGADDEDPDDGADDVTVWAWDE